MSGRTSSTLSCPGSRYSLYIREEMIALDSMHGKEPLPFVFNDGGRAAAGFKGFADDCTCRAITIATGRDYRETYDMLNALGSVHDSMHPRQKGKSSARTGVPMKVIHALLKQLGWVWTPTMGIGSGCTVHLRTGELPSGVLIVRLSKHLTTVIDGLIHDTHDCGRQGSRCVYGYFSPSDN